MTTLISCGRSNTPALQGVWNPAMLESQHQTTGYKLRAPRLFIPATKDTPTEMQNSSKKLWNNHEDVEKH